MNVVAAQTGRMSNSQIIRAKMQLTCHAANEAFAQFWARPDLSESIPGFLVTLQQIMRATVPLMEAARDEAARMATRDPLCRHLRDYYGKHVGEELDHDIWALEDLEEAGYARDSVLDMLPLGDVASMMGAQYYWIHHFHPVMMLGCIAVLEGGPPSKALIDRLERESNLPAAAFRTYRFHGDVDPHHRDDLNNALDQMPLTRRHLGLIGISATHTANTLADIVSRISSTDAPPRHV